MLGLVLPPPRPCTISGTFPFVRSLEILCSVGRIAWDMFGEAFSFSKMIFYILGNARLTKTKNFWKMEGRGPFTYEKI